MNIFNITGPKVEMLRRGLNLTSDRHIATTSNIANAETPNYRAVEIPFKKHLENNLKGISGPETPKTTHPKHFPHKGDTSWKFRESNASPRIDGNNVNLDQEIMGLNEEDMKYQTMSRILSLELSRLVNAISLGGNRR